MTPSFAISLDALSGWRMTLGRRLDDVSRYLADHELVDAQAAVQLGAGDNAEVLVFDLAP